MFPSNLQLGKTCLHWHWFNLNMKPVFVFGNLKWWSYKNNSFPSFQLVTRINSQDRNEILYINILRHIILYMNIGISNWHNWIFDETNMMFSTSFHFLTRFLNQKYLKIFSTYLVVRNGAMWKTWFSAPQNVKKEYQLKHKNEVHNRLFIDS